MFADSCFSEICLAVRLFQEPEKCYVYFWPYRNDNLITIPEIIPYSFEVQAPENTISWYWDFGDGEISNEPNPVHGYNFEGGIYNVCLTISTSDDCVQTYCTDLYVGWQDTVISPDCQAGYYYTVMESYPPQYAFTDNSYGEAVEWFWDFGDGEYSSDPNPVHIFKAKPWYSGGERPENSDSSGIVFPDSVPPGDYFVPVPPDYSYMVCLTIRTVSGCSSTYCEYVMAPIDTFIVPETCNYMIQLNTSSILGIACSGTATATLYDPLTGLNVPASAYWSTGSYVDFVAGLCANMPYYVILTSPEGCTVAGSFTVMDYSVPVYTFGYWSYSGAGEDYRFTYNTPDNTYQCYWDFGNGVVLEGNEVDYTITDDLNGPVNLTVYDANGNLVHSEQIKVGAATAVVDPVEKSVRMYPNPVSDLLYLDLGENNYDFVDFMILDVTGRTVRSLRLSGNSYEPYSVDVSELPSGIYLGRVMYKNQLIATGKILK